MIFQEVDGVRYSPEEGSIVAESYGEKKKLFLDEDAKDFCVGVYGDGCGGGRIFVLYASYVKVYDLESDAETLLLDELQESQNISKNGCILSIQTASETVKFNLSSMSKEKA